MGIINVDGIGKVQIQGDNPTQEEFEVIESAVLSYKEKKKKKTYRNNKKKKEEEGGVGRV